MKFTVVILIVLGLIAAVSAMFLVGALHTDKGPDGKKLSADTEVILLKESLPAMTVITSGHIITKTMPRKDLPDKYISSSAQVIGKVLSVPVTKDQVMTRNCLVSEGSGALLAAAIPHGMRAVSVTLSKNAISGGLLYPGCVVDVLVSFKLQGQGVRGEALSTTLLRSIQVLAIGDTTVISEKNAEDKEGARNRGDSASRVTVTLLVNPKQAEAMQLATSYGTLSLAMRNPLDKELVDVDATVLSQGRLAKLGSLLTPAVLSNQQKMDRSLTTHSSAKQDRTAASDDIDIYDAHFQTDTLSGYRDYHANKPSEEKSQSRSSSHWGVTVIRGREMFDQELDIMEDEVLSMLNSKR
jgi:pilus assembly protein CpaB